MSHAASTRYRHVNPHERAKFLLRWYELITNAREDIAKFVVYETGKPMAEAIGEVDYALEFAWGFTGQAERLRGSIALPSISNRRTFVINQPIRVSVALAPWNFRGHDHSQETPLSVMSLADLALRVGLTPGVLNTTDNEYTPAISERLYKHPLVGKLVGNCRFIIFDDGDLDQAVAALMILKLRTTGQACTHANPIENSRSAMEKILLLPWGLLMTSRGMEKLNRHVSDAVSKGGKLLLFSGKQPYGPQGYFFEPTIISDMISDMLASQEEIFGPPFSLYRFEIEDEARFLESLEAGIIGMNTGKSCSLVVYVLLELEHVAQGNASCAESPFGGKKESGYGKEAGKDVAIEEHLVSKTGTLTVEGVAGL
ncbi:Aldehyde/histidinol dehydrogenase [Aspergillus alliaceus]|uniref:Aldehyde/histidinol dehydrogenase n=1 Tax=Petromyces alliaceus TaxID=209559 RepID=UPI0012A5E053|nr:Aldehyde/histidinol dehydrogenase [Aspergillus alliaceus]KAB8234012.1 Aldehyde/histidinol dehydrogenase [Aspergillus alliaceus]